MNDVIFRSDAVEIQSGLGRAQNPESAMVRRGRLDGRQTRNHSDHQLAPSPPRAVAKFGPEAIRYKGCSRIDCFFHDLFLNRDFALWTSRYRKDTNGQSRRHGVQFMFFIGERTGIAKYVRGAVGTQRPRG